MELSAPLATVCEVLDAPRSTIYARRVRRRDGNVTWLRPGPAGDIDDERLLALIRQVLAGSPFTGEGYRKVHTRLRREHGVRVGRKRVLRLMRDHQLLAPQRMTGRRKPRPHDGTIVPDAPDVMWGTDATMAYTTEDGWVWLFATIDHYTAEAWTHVAARGDRFAALQPVYDAVIDRFGTLEADVARGLSLRHDWGPQYRSGHFHRLDPLARPRRLARLRRRGRDQRLRGALHPHPQRAMPVGPALHHDRRTAPGRGQLHPPVQHRMAHRTPRPPHPTRGPCRHDELIPSRVINNRRVQGTGCCSEVDSGLTANTR
jgi:hypothetical protein